MKNLLKFLSPFAPDQSGAVAALYELGGLIVICDAGGCTGNICGFDEPRWENRSCALFSAGLRDMDAILGRDDKLILKLSDAVEQTNVSFTAIIGTPVPAVIATDFLALKRMAEKKTGLPCVTVEATGVGYYDKGAEAALLQLFKLFATEKHPVKAGKIGILGATPLDISRKTADKLISACGNAVCYGMGSGLEDVKNASEAEKNVVVSPSAIKTAEYLKDKFGTPYTLDYPLLSEEQASVKSEKILVIHQQIAANALRERLINAGNTRVDVAGFFMMKPDLMQEKDFRLDGEEQLAEKIIGGGYTAVIADSHLRRALRGYNGEFVDFPHFAVSGRLESEA